MKKTAETDMTSGAVLPLLRSFTLPLLFGNLFQQMYSLTDAVVVGNTIGVNAFAAVGCTSWFVWILTAVARDFANSFSITASYRFGNGNRDDAERIAATALLTALVLSASTTIFCLLHLPHILGLFKVNSSIYADAEKYLKIYLLSVPLMIFSNFSNGLLRAAGNSRIMFLSMAISTIVNILLDCIFVVVFDLGVSGVAAATVIAHAVSALLCISILFRSGYLPQGRILLSFRKDLFFEALRIFFPMLLNSVVIATGGIAVQRCINELGTSYSAGIAACNKVNSVMETFIISLSSFASVFVGQNYGAKNYRRIRSGMQTLLLVSSFLTLFISAFEWFFSGKTVSLFLATNNPDLYSETLRIAVIQLRVFSVNFIFWTPMYIYRASLQALGHSEYALYSGIIQLIMRILSITILPNLIGIQAYFCPTLLATVVCLPMVMIPFNNYLKSLSNR